MRTTWAIRNQYETLELPRDATPEEIKARYRVLSKVWHPDRFGDDGDVADEATARFQAIKEAYEQLSDPAEREMVDLALGPESIDAGMFDEAAQNHPATWKRMSAWMKDEDVGTGFHRRMAYTAGDLIERRRQPTDKQRRHMIEAWEIAVAEGFDPDGPS